MDVLGKLRELVAIIFQKDNQDIRIQPNASTTYTATTTVNLPDNDAATQELTGNAATQTLTNKTIVAANNTVTTAASGNIASTELDAAIAEGDTNLTNHLNDATDAHAGSAITNTPSGNLAATDMQGAVDELQTELDSATTHTSDTANPHSVTASQVGLGNVTNVATDDTAYNATSWDANNDAATKNAIRDKVETMDTAIGLNTAKVSADGSVTSHSDVTDAGSGAIITGAERTKLDGIEELEQRLTNPMPKLKQPTKIMPIPMPLLMPTSPSLMVSKPVLM